MKPPSLSLTLGFFAHLILSTTIFAQRPATTGAVVSDPVLDIGTEGLRGMAWLEGERADRLELRAARFENGRWLEPVVVSPQGTGSQLALSSATLADGSWLLVWSAFDGEDDEILWSRLADGRFSPPRPVAADNAVPDVTPALGVLADGVLVAWSRYDGNDYRIVLARFDGESWSEPEVVGPRGSLAPSFEKAAGTSFLLFQTAVPRSWSIAELDARGKVLRRARSEAFRLERPLVEKVATEGIELRWPGEIGGKSALALWQ